MHKPKSTKEIYVDSLAVNASNLEKQLLAQEVSEAEIEKIRQCVSREYHGKLQTIVEECDRDMMALERVPSPLRLFVDCLARCDSSQPLSGQSRSLIRLYVSAWEDWM